MIENWVFKSFIFVSLYSPQLLPLAFTSCIHSEESIREGIEIVAILEVLYFIFLKI